MKTGHFLGSSAAAFASASLFCAGAPHAFCQSLDRSFKGEQMFSSFGDAVAILGDVNGDGIKDLSVGAPRYGLEDIGRVAVLSGKDGSILYSLDGPSKFCSFGFSLADVGDQDDDGIDDFVVGAPNQTTAVQSEGMAFVYSGKSGQAFMELYGPALLRGYLGYVVGRADDLDGDGKSEIFASAPGNDNGHVFLFSSSTGEVMSDLRGDIEGGWFGAAAAAMGDADGDRLGDLLIGAPMFGVRRDNSGRAFICSSKSLAPLASFQGATASSFLGIAVAAIGDLDDDGQDDCAVAESGKKTGQGAVHLYSSASAKELGTVIAPLGSKSFAYQIASAGDWDGDGSDDLLVSAKRADTKQPAAVMVFSTASLSELTRMQSPRIKGLGSPNSSFGRALAPATDMDGDGRLEILIGEGLRLYETGAVHLFRQK